MRRDPLIIGAGPAGTAAAITLGRAGCRPVLIERGSGSADKVCGDFLGVDSIRHAQALGVDPTVLGGVPIHCLRLFHGERRAEAALPFPALGLSRRLLDAALLHQAEASGAVAHTGRTVRRLTRDPAAGRPSVASPAEQAGPNLGAGAWTAEMDQQRNAQAADRRRSDEAALTADTVFLATGKHDLREFPRRSADRGAVGMKMYFSLAPGPAKTLDGAIELTLFPGGYAGMQPVENDRVVLCVAIQRRAFQRCGGLFPDLLVAIGQHSRRFAAMLADARPLLSRPLAIAGVPYGYQARSAAVDGLFRVGDQAAVIPSLTGDGMAIALHSGRTAAETWLAGGDSAAYHRALARTLGPQMRLAGLLHHACMSGPVQSAVLHSAALFPALLRHAAARTRLPCGLPSGLPSGP